jgi:hypothetical protein
VERQHVEATASADTLGELLEVEARTRRPGEHRGEVAEGAYQALVITLEHLPGLDRVPSVVADWLFGHTKPWVTERVAATIHGPDDGSARPDRNMAGWDYLQQQIRRLAGVDHDKDVEE